MTENNLFEEASRKKLRFPTERGELSVEQLWDLPLTSDRGLSLDAIAIGINVQLKAVSEDSFVKPQSNPRKAQYEMMLEIIKHIIAVKQTEAAERAAAVENRARRLSG